ncbi:serum albumin [Limosa lapponica baueri]|uniref:Serum albumin n=1 Tax=Limosa lapponica baueri TaxID=1758121 RepID=A0A2I0T5Y5_LIMLA|nr:serum albumin [Limosa lapponica baueri]
MRSVSCSSSFSKREKQEIAIKERAKKVNMKQQYSCGILKKFGERTFKAKFVYEYSRRHPEFSTQLILRVTKGYETLLDKCCKTDNPAECYGNAQEELNKHIKETQDVVKTNCDILTTHGEADFLKASLSHISPIEVGKAMTLDF